LFYQGLYFYCNGLKIRVSAVQIHPWMHHAFSPRLDNALLSYGAGTENNTKELKSQKVNSKITNQNSNTALPRCELALNNCGTSNPVVPEKLATPLGKELV